MDEPVARLIPPRHRPVLELVVAGLTDRQIAARLGMSERTVQRRVRALCLATGATSRVDLAVRAVATGAAEARPEQRGSTA